MNNKGFTTVEVIISFALVVIVMVSMTSMLVSYRDTITNEEIKTRMTEFKNSITYMLYEDIVYHKIDGVRYCDENASTVSGSDVKVSNGKCVDFMRDGESQYRLELIEDQPERDANSENQWKYKTYLNYRGILIMLPDSDLNKVEYKKKANGQYETDSTGKKIVDKTKQVSVIYDFIIPSDESSLGVTSLTIPFEHHGIDYYDKIKVVITK